MTVIPSAIYKYQGPFLNIRTSLDPQKYASCYVFSDHYSTLFLEKRVETQNSLSYCDDFF